MRFYTATRQQVQIVVGLFLKVQQQWLQKQLQDIFIFTREHVNTLLLYRCRCVFYLTQNMTL